MSLLLNKEDFDALPRNEKEDRLDKYLHTQYSISQLNNNEELQKQFSLLLKLQPKLITRFGKFLIINVTEKKFVQCCDDLQSALDLIYGFDHKKESFIYQLPEIV